MLTKPIYIESLIDTTVEEVWARTQDPAVHQRWDVRFAQIDYLPTVEGEPQRFVYSTTVMPGLTVDGCGETLGERHRPDGTAYSGLKFWSDHPISLIEEGAGYWRYIPAENGVRFLTRYDYRVRWGMFGWIIDRFVFRPIFGFGTAWSFDRLRMWIEEGVSPERSRNNTIATAISMTTLIVGCIAHALSTGFATPGAGQIIAAVLLIASTATTGRNLPSGRRPLRGKADREATVSARPSAFTRSRPFGPGRSGLSAQLPRTQPSTPSQIKPRATQKAATS